MNESSTFPHSESAPLHALGELILFAQTHQVLRKVVFSKSRDTRIRRAVLSPRQMGGRVLLQMETFQTDHKALHRNLDPADITCLTALVEAAAPFAQINVITTAGEAEYRRSKSDHETLIGGDKLRRAIETGGGQTVKAEGNNKEKQYILNGSEPFLQYLGISDRNGRVYDKNSRNFVRSIAFSSMSATSCLISHRKAPSASVICVAAKAISPSPSIMT